MSKLDPGPQFSTGASRADASDHSPSGLLLAKQTHPRTWLSRRSAATRQSENQALQPCSVSAALKVSERHAPCIVSLSIKRLSKSS